MHEEFMGFVSDETSYRMVRNVAEARGWPAAVVQQGGLDMLADMLENYAPPKILLLDLDAEKDVLPSATRAIGLCGPDSQIIFLAKHNDVSLYRQFIQLGASDYLVKPISEESLLQAIINASKPKKTEEADANKEERGCKIIPVIGTRGGVGVTTVAVNLSWILSNKLNQQVGLLDLDMQFGSTALALDREPGRGMRAALENPERLDGLLIASSMVQHSDKFSILCAEDTLEQHFHFDGDATLGLLKPIRSDFDYMLVDLPRHHISSQKTLLNEAHAILIVADLTLASLRDARRIKLYLKNLRPDLLPMLIVNHVGDSPYSTIDQPTFEKNLEAKIDVILNEDIKTAKQSANLGKPFASVAPDAPITKSLIALARTLSGQKEVKKQDVKGSLFKGLLGTKPTKPAAQS
ncbi:MAG: AAA family ATPase [Alphaproteobacteria bacterium]|nr:AAA family ATPase [Alphaproteobacteria bacterium]